jgi:hypothetical protein
MNMNQIIKSRVLTLNLKCEIHFPWMSFVNILFVLKQESESNLSLLSSNGPKM